MKQFLFQYAVLWHPTKEQFEKDGKKSVLVVEPSTILAKDQNSATMTIVRKIPEQFADQLDQIEIAIRPF